MSALAFPVNVIRSNIELFNQLSRVVVGKLVNFVKNDGSENQASYYLGKDEDGKAWVRPINDTNLKSIIVGLLPGHYHPTAFVLEEKLDLKEIQKDRNQIDAMRIKCSAKEFRKKFKQTQGCFCSFIKNSDCSIKHTGHLLGFDNKARIWMINKNGNYEVCILGVEKHQYHLESVNFHDRLDIRSEEFSNSCLVALNLSI